MTSNTSPPIDHERAIRRLSFVKACSTGIAKCEREGKLWSLPDLDLAGSVDVDHLPPRALYSPHLDAAEMITSRCVELTALHDLLRQGTDPKTYQETLAKIDALTTELRVAWGALTAPKKRRYWRRPKVTI